MANAESDKENIKNEENLSKSFEQMSINDNTQQQQFFEKEKIIQQKTTSSIPSIFDELQETEKINREKNLSSKIQEEIAQTQTTSTVALTPTPPSTTTTSSTSDESDKTTKLQEEAVEKKKEKEKEKEKQRLEPSKIFIDSSFKTVQNDMKNVKKIYKSLRKLYDEFIFLVKEENNYAEFMTKLLSIIAYFGKNNCFSAPQIFSNVFFLFYVCRDGTTKRSHNVAVTLL